MTTNNLAKILRVAYTNWRGVKAIRTIVPISIEFTTSEYHGRMADGTRQKEWIMTCYDMDRKEKREFLLRDMDFTYDRRS